MPSIIESLYSYYYLVFILQGICVFHSIRKGTQQKWIWIIVFVPFFGSLAYIFTEMLKKNQFTGLQQNISVVVNPNGKIAELEKQYRFSATFKNKVALAEAYLAMNRASEAIELFESALIGINNDDEYVMLSLLKAYYAIENDEGVVKIGKKLAKSSLFQKSEANLYYANSLEKEGYFDLAKSEYQKMDLRLSNYEARYNYALFLLRRNETNTAKEVLENIINEHEILSKAELKQSKKWINAAEAELKKRLD